MDLLVNGEARAVDCSEDDTLLHVLRNHLDLMGTRFGCGHEACGACMVLVDGAPAWSCTARAADLAGKAVVTVEGLPALERLRQAFLDEQAGAVRVLPVRHSGVRVRAAGIRRGGGSRGGGRGARPAPLPLRCAQPDRAGGAACGRAGG